MKCERMDILMLHTNTRTDMLQAMNVYKIKLLHAVSVYEWFICVWLENDFTTRRKYDDFINGLKNLLIIIFVKYKNF